VGRSIWRGSLALGLVAGVSTPPLEAQVEGEAAFSSRPSEDTGWQSDGTEFPIPGSPNAKRALQDRPLKVWWQTFPPTLRVDGPNSRLVQTTTLHDLIYESLIGIHYDTEEFIGRLADEWRIQTDFKSGTQTFWFRIDPKARFSDGSPVTAEDVYASWWHKVQEDRSDPSNVLVFSQYEEPVVVDERTIKVTTKTLNWRLFLYFGGPALKVYPKERIMIPGEEYLERYNWEWIPGSGPYHMLEEDLKEGQSLTLTRRDDWWAKDERWAKHSFNFKKLKFTVVRDQELLYQKFLAGEFDHYRIARAQRWAEEVPKEPAVVQGWVQRRKIYNQAPEGFQGIVMNMRRPPFDDIRVRKAFAHLFNRERLNEKLFFEEYEMLDSYIPGRDWGNGEDNEKLRFDPDLAEELLWEAGYKERDDDGFLIGPDGERFELTLVYSTQSWERIWLVVQEDYEDAGIKLNLKLMDAASLIKKIGERQFKIHFQPWNALLFPNPRTSWSSVLADKPQNNNIPGFKSEEVDKLLELYDVTFDREEQKKITRRIDELVFQQYPYALGWYANFERILYWNRFGHPKTYWSRTGQYHDWEILSYWWWDPEKIEALDAAMKDGSKLPQGEVVHYPWADWKQ